MTPKPLIAIAAAFTAFVTPAAADPASDLLLVTGGGAAALPMMLQCVPYARAVSGITIFGDAHTWWKQAEGRYARGLTPKVGAVMAFKPHGRMELGHVAAVSRIIDSRTVLLRHANWSLINGTRGQIENDVRAIDVSPNNDWSAVRVWFAPLQGLGGTAWPVQGFIYNAKPSRNEKLVRAPAGDSTSRFLADAPRDSSRESASTVRRSRVAGFDPIGAIIAKGGR